MSYGACSPSRSFQVDGSHRWSSTGIARLGFPLAVVVRLDQVPWNVLPSKSVEISYYEKSKERLWRPGCPSVTVGLAISYKINALLRGEE